MSNLQRAQKLCDVLFKIPPPNKGPVPLRSLYEDLAGDGVSEYSKGCVDAVIDLLQTFGAVEIRDLDGEKGIKAVSDIAFYFIRSLALHVKHAFAVIGEWYQEQGPRDRIWSVPLVMQMERNRIVESHALGVTPEPLRRVAVAFVIIKAREQGKEVYLLEYNRNWQAYSFIGGIQEDRDKGGLRATAIREAEEELSLSRDKFRVIELPLREVIATNFSRSCGAYTEYRMKTYQAFIDVPYSPPDGTRWFAKQELLQGRGNDGEAILLPLEYREALAEELPGGLDALLLSLPYPSRKFRARLGEWLRANQSWLEVAAAILTILSVIAGLEWALFR